MKNQWDGSPKPEALAQLRTAYGYTQAEAAELCRVTLRAWQWWEAGQ
ncbi:MAG: XRE family transcriptional regulator, partial [Betaproteobacteria bacterium]|nr:XRE family transcriptional regulator [Betaproteobacteria bacterium]